MFISRYPREAFQLTFAVRYNGTFDQACLWLMEQLTARSHSSAYRVYWHNQEKTQRIAEFEVDGCNFLVTESDYCLPNLREGRLSLFEGL